MGEAPPTVSARKLCRPELGWHRGVCADKPLLPARMRASGWDIVFAQGPSGIIQSGAETGKGTSDSMPIIVASGLAYAEGQ